MRKKIISNSIHMLSRFRLSIIITLILILLLINFYILFGMKKYYIFTHVADTNKVAHLENVPEVQEFLNEMSNDSLKDSKTEFADGEKCPNFGESIKIVIVVTSSPKNAKSRDAIRRTWGSIAKRKDIVLVFNVGKAKKEHLNREIKEEQDLFGDIIRGSFLDIYNNLTLKTTWMLEWVMKFCSKALFLLKVDDDVFLNIDLLLDFVNQNKINQSRSIYGRVVKNWHPIEEEKHKYYISSKYETESLPDFTTGPAYIMPTKLASELYNEARNMRYTKFEDVFYTGIVATRLNISRVHVPEFANKWIDLTDCSLKKTISVHGAPEEYVHYMWFRINSVSAQVCGT